MIRFPFVVLAASLLPFALSSFAGESEAGFSNRPLTLEDAVALALKQNPTILSQIQQLKATRGLVFQAQSRLLPQLTGAGNLAATDPGLQSTGSSSSGASPVDLLAVPSGQNLVVTSSGQTNAVAIPVSGLFGGLNRSSANETWQVTLTLSQLIWDGGATIAARRQARINEDAAYYTLRDDIDQVVANVITQFDQ
ncbi:MAG: TolC family protein, partial [Verrucomicrobia bacterium]|nr:TolC family protein [Verrucomicrobiota bacterium]